MASELGSGPHSGLGVQLCGDAHLCNFGLFGSAERNLVFDINDFSHSPGALPPDALIDPDTISDIVVWLARDASSLVTAAQIPADKGYLKV